MNSISSTNAAPLDADSCRVAILAGGQGTRLASRSGDMPKPMIRVLGKPLLQYQIEACRDAGFTEIALLVHFRYEAIEDYFGDGSAFGVRIRYLIEKSPRGTSGALRDALPYLARRFLVMYGDTYLDVDLLRIWERHSTSNACATLLLHPNDHPQDSDLVALDALGYVSDIFPYPHPNGVDHRNLVNAALYVLEREGLNAFTPAEGKADIAKHMFPAMLAAGRRILGYVTPEYIKDIGTPERLDKVEYDIVSGVPERLSMRTRRVAVFLDRDGTLIEEVGHLRRPDQVRLLNGAASAVRRLNRAGRLSVVVTNQPVLARGDVTPRDLEAIHARVESCLGEAGAYLDKIYLCPHHPDRGFPGEVPELKVVCECRKPAPGMLDQACRELNIARSDSWIVGDSAADIEAGRRADVRTILVRTGHAGSGDQLPLRPDYVMPDLAAAVDWILEGHARTARSLLPLVQRAQEGIRVVLVSGQARAGKSSAAQVLKEQFTGLGRTAHVIPLDAWLQPDDQRPEGAGVLARYDLEAASEALAGIAVSASRETLVTRVNDRRSKCFFRHSLQHSIGPKDLLIIEGVLAFHLAPALSAIPTLRLFVAVDEQTRLSRLEADYAWRGFDAQAIHDLLVSRMADEVPAVAASATLADFTLSLSTYA
jgi:histidinol-phosphate phosphatase family protein